MKDKKNKIRIGIFLLFLFPAMASAQSKTAIDPPIASVRFNKQEVVTQSQLTKSMEIIQRQTGHTLTQPEKEQLLDEMIGQIILVQAASKDMDIREDKVLQMLRQNIAAGLPDQAMQLQILGSTDAQIKDLIEKQMGVTYEVARRSIIEQLYVSEKKAAELQKVTPPTKEAVESFYRNNSTQFINPELVFFSHIYFDSRKESNKTEAQALAKANEINAQLVAKKATFEQLAREFSEDPQSAAQNGSMGILARTDRQAETLFGPDFVNSVFEIKPGNVSKVLKSDIGYHIVKVTEHRDQKFLKLDDPVAPLQKMTVREYITGNLENAERQQVFAKARKELIDGLRERADITIYKDKIVW